MITRRTNLLSILLLSYAGLTLLGCAPPRQTDYEAFLKSPRPVIAGKPYVIDPPDSIAIGCPAVPEINNLKPTLRPDGYITLPLIGEHFAAGKTPMQLANELEEKLLKFYKDASVTIIVHTFASKSYYLAGETAAGPKSYTGKDTILKAVLSGGLPASSWPKHVLVIRPNENAEFVKRMTVNMDRMIKYGDLKYNIILEEGDIIYIPINPIAAFGRTVQNLLSPVSPALRAATTPGRIANTNLESGRNTNNNNNFNN